VRRGPFGLCGSAVPKPGPVMGLRLPPRGGWVCRHITDRTIYLVKEDAVYRDLLGRDGYVLHRVEPGVSRETMVDQAYAIAEENDARLGLRIGERMLPANFKAEQRAAKYAEGSVVVSVDGERIFSLPEYRAWQAAFRPVFATPEDPQLKVYRP
jgi:hypothetical protein